MYKHETSGVLQVKSFWKAWYIKAAVWQEDADLTGGGGGGGGGGECPDTVPAREPRNTACAAETNTLEEAGACCRLQGQPSDGSFSAAAALLNWLMEDEAE